MQKTIIMLCIVLLNEKIFFDNQINHCKTKIKQETNQSNINYNLTYVITKDSQNYSRIYAISDLDGYQQKDIKQKLADQSHYQRFLIFPMKDKWFAQILEKYQSKSFTNYEDQEFTNCIAGENWIILQNSHLIRQQHVKIEIDLSTKIEYGNFNSDYVRNTTSSSEFYQLSTRFIGLYFSDLSTDKILNLTPYKIFNNGIENSIKNWYIEYKNQNEIIQNVIQIEEINSLSDLIVVIKNVNENIQMIQQASMIAYSTNYFLNSIQESQNQKVYLSNHQSVEFTSNQIPTVIYSKNIDYIIILYLDDSQTLVNNKCSMNLMIIHSIPKVSAFNYNEENDLKIFKLEFENCISNPKIESYQLVDDKLLQFQVKIDKQFYVQKQNVQQSEIIWNELSSDPQEIENNDVISQMKTFQIKSNQTINNQFGSTFKLIIKTDCENQNQNINQLNILSNIIEIKCSLILSEMSLNNLKSELIFNNQNDDQYNQEFIDYDNSDINEIIYESKFGHDSKINTLIINQNNLNRYIYNFDHEQILGQNNYQHNQYRVIESQLNHDNQGIFNKIYSQINYQNLIAYQKTNQINKQTRPDLYVIKNLLFTISTKSNNEQINYSQHVLDETEHYNIYANNLNKILDQDNICNNEILKTEVLFEFSPNNSSLQNFDNIKGQNSNLSNDSNSFDSWNPNNIIGQDSFQMNNKKVSLLKALYSNNKDIEGKYSTFYNFVSAIKLFQQYNQSYEKQQIKGIQNENLPLQTVYNIQRIKGIQKEQSDKKISKLILKIDKGSSYELLNILGDQNDENDIENFTDYTGINFIFSNNKLADVQQSDQNLSHQFEFNNFDNHIYSISYQIDDSQISQIEIKQDSKCHSSCSTCLTTYTQDYSQSYIEQKLTTIHPQICTKCNIAYLNESQQDTNPPDCPSCQPFCIYCSDLGNCNMCQEDYLVLVLENSNQICIPLLECLETPKLVRFNNQCFSCQDPYCMECQPDDTRICLLCQPGTHLHNNECVAECPAGTYKETIPDVQNGSRCSICPSPMESCFVWNRDNFKSIAAYQCTFENEQTKDRYYLTSNDKKCIPKSECEDKIGWFTQSDSKGINWCYPCKKNCKKCSGLSSNDCTECSEGLFRQEDSNRCTSTCDTGYQADPNNLICRRCNASCKRCNPMDKTECQQCQSQFLEKDKKCMDSGCGPNKYFSNSENTCKTCSEKCRECDEDGCISCEPTSGLQLFTFQVSEDKYTRICLDPVKPCQSGMYLELSNDLNQSAKCELCEGSCKECKGPMEHQCMACRSGFQSMILGDNRSQCRTSCETGQVGLAYWSGVDNICKKCSDIIRGCSECLSNQNSIVRCNKCKPGYLPHNIEFKAKTNVLMTNLICIANDDDICLDGFQRDQDFDQPQCSICPEGCEKCETNESEPGDQIGGQGNQNCLKCKPNYAPKQIKWQNDNNLFQTGCERCDELCTECTIESNGVQSNSTCTKCVNTAFLVNGKCIYSCQHGKGFKQKDNEWECVNCPVNCGSGKCYDGKCIG